MSSIEARRRYYERHAEIIKAKQRQRVRLRTEEENRRRSLVDRGTPKGYLTGLVGASRQRAQKRGIEHDLTRDQLLDLYHRQEGVCALTGLKMTTIPGQGRVRTNVSLDRIDASGPYTISNVQLVCDLANTMRQNLSVEEFVDLCRLVVANAEEAI